ncbi:MAG: hypothetical protein ABJL55_05910 [Roseibium sp.]
MNQNICYDRGIVYIHNPNAAGTCFRDWLGFEGQTELGFPTLTTHHVFWNKYKVVVAIRDPIDRALSSYRSLTSETYSGELKRKYPSMHTWNTDKFFNTILNDHLYICACQYKYTQHLQSNKPPDYLVKTENLDMESLSKGLDICEPFPGKKMAENKTPIDIDEKLYLELIEYYKVDYLLFGYKPKSFKVFMEQQLAAAA